MDTKNPPYYKKTIETCDAILSQLNNDDERIGALKYCVMKYVCRFGSKEGGVLAAQIKDCEKGNWYINKLYTFLKKKEEKQYKDILDRMDEHTKNVQKTNHKLESNITKLFEKEKDE